MLLNDSDVLLCVMTDQERTRAGVIYSCDYYQEFSHTQTLPTSASLTERQPMSLEWEWEVVPVTHSTRVVVINFF